MALARCKQCGKPKGRTKSYIRSVNPVGFPDTAVICGSSACENPALIWLDENETQAFIIGQTVFEFPTAAMKVQVTGDKEE